MVICDGAEAALSCIKVITGAISNGRNQKWRGSQWFVPEGGYRIMCLELNPSRRGEARTVQKSNVHQRLFNTVSTTDVNLPYPVVRPDQSLNATGTTSVAVCTYLVSRLAFPTGSSPAHRLAGNSNIR